MQLRLRIPMFVAATACASCLLISCRQPTVAAADTPTVPTATVQPANLSNELVLTAEFTPYQDVDVMAKVAGYVKNIRVDIGDHVREGELLATLEVPELQDEIAKATAGLAAAEANIITARGAVKRAEAGADIAHLSFQRIQDVAVKQPGLGAKARGGCRTGARPGGGGSTSGSAIRIAECGAAEDTGRIRTLARRCDAAICDNTSPFAGVITKRYANTGSMIQAGISSQTQAMPVVTAGRE